MNVNEEQFFNFIRRSATSEIYKDPETWSSETQRYLHKFKAKSDKRFFLSWNWAAFVFRETWFVFRKMYFFAIIYTIFPFALLGIVLLLKYGFSFLLPSLDASFLEVLYLLAFFLAILIYIILPALLGDSVYIAWVKKKISKNKKKKKGITWIGGIVSWYLWPTFLSILFVGLMGGRE